MEHKSFVKALGELSQGNIADLLVQTDHGEVVRRFCPKERLIVLGGGHVALPLASIAGMVDFQVIVVDDRPLFANRERFPMADEVICDSFIHALDGLKITEDDYICVVTRGHRYDEDCLKRILSGTWPFYVGMLGSKGRVKALKEKLLKEGYDREKLEQVHAPIGLDIHALTTSEIAVSIAGEMIAHRRKDKKKTIGFETEVLAQTNIDRKLLELAADEKRKSVIALVTATKGSTPVKPGAIMLVGELGLLAGTIGGGCKEAEVITLARSLVGTGQSQSVTLQLLGDMEEEDSMVCGGIMEVFLSDLD